MSSNGNFVLRWDLHEETRTSTLKSFLNNEDFLDVTIACDDDQIDAHKVILSAASPFFQNILKRNPHSHPLLYLRGTLKKDVLALLDFIYSGETQVLEEELNDFMTLANSLKIKGLIGEISKPNKMPLTTKNSYQINPLNNQNTSNKQLLEGKDYKIVEQEVDMHIKHEMQKKKEWETVELAEEMDNIIFEEIEVEPEKKKKKKEVKPEKDFPIVELNEETEHFNSEDNDSFQYQNTPKTSMTEYNARKAELVTRTENGCWTCTDCTYVSKNRGHLLEHTETHITGFSHECGNCEKTFRTNKSRRLHMYKCGEGKFAKNRSF